MFKKAFIVVAAVAAMALPAAALGDGGTPAPDPGAKIAAAQAKLEALKAKCDSSPKASARCAKVAANVLQRLDKISARIDTAEGKINSEVLGGKPAREVLAGVGSPPEARCGQAGHLPARVLDPGELLHLGSGPRAGSPVGDRRPGAARRPR